MKRFKKALSLCMALVMVFTLCSCQPNVEKKFFELIGEANAFDTGSFSTEFLISTDIDEDTLESIKSVFDVNLDNDKLNLKFKVDGLIDSAKNEVDGRIGVSLGDTYTDLTEVVVKDNKIYLNVYDFLINLMNIPTIKNAVVENISAEAYQQILDETKKVFEGKEFVTVEPDDANFDNFEFDSYMGVIKNSQFYKDSWAFMKDTITSFKPTVITKDKNVYTMELSNENTKILNDKAQEFAKENAESIYNLFYDMAAANDAQFATLMFMMFNPTPEDNFYPASKEEALKAIEDSKEAIVKKLEESPNMTITNSGIESENEPKNFTGKMSISVQKNKNTITEKVNVEDHITSMTVNSVLTTEAVSIEAPENAASVEELMDSLSKNEFFSALIANLTGVEVDNSNYEDYKAEALGDIESDIDNESEYVENETERNDDNDYVENIEISSIKNEVIAENVEKYMKLLKKNGYTDVSINFVFGDYEVAGDKGEIHTEIEFDEEFGEEENGYLDNFYIVFESETKEAGKEEVIKKTVEAFTELFDMKLSADDVIEAMNNPENEYSTGSWHAYVEGPDDEFSIDYSTNEEYQYLTPECSIFYFF